VASTAEGLVVGSVAAPAEAEDVAVGPPDADPLDADPLDADPLEDDPLDDDPLDDDPSGGLDVGAALEAPPEQAPSIRHRSPSAAAAVRGRRVVVMAPSLTHAPHDGQRTCRVGTVVMATAPPPATALICTSAAHDGIATADIRISASEGAEGAEAIGGDRGGWLGPTRPSASPRA
jgi:hypothetical protein